MLLLLLLSDHFTWWCVFVVQKSCPCLHTCFCIKLSQVYYCYEEETLSNVNKIRWMRVNNAFVTAKLDSCNSLLYGLPKHLLSRLQSIQNTAARVVTHTGKFDHITPVLKQLHWLPVCYRIISKILLLVYKALNGTVPYYISELLRYNTSQWKLRSSSQHLLATPKARLKTYGERAFAVAAPRL